MYKAERESARPVFLQGGGFFLTPGCPVSSGAGAHAGQGLRKGPLQTLQASWASGRPATPTPPTSRSGASRMLQEVSAAMLTGGRGRAARDRGTVGPWDRGPLPSLPLRSSLWGATGRFGGTSRGRRTRIRTPNWGFMQAVSQLRGRLEPSFGSFPGHPGCSIWSRFLFFSPLFLFS